MEKNSTPSNIDLEGRLTAIETAMIAIIKELRESPNSTIQDQLEQEYERIAAFEPDSAATKSALKWYDFYLI